MNPFVFITLKNFEKHNPRKDQKSFTWFRMNNDIHQDPMFLELNQSQKWAFVCILCDRSRQNSPILKTTIKKLCVVSGATEEEIVDLIEKMEFFGVASHTRTDPYGHVTDTRGSEREFKVTNKFTSPTYTTDTTYKQDKQTNKQTNVLITAEENGQIAPKRKREVSPRLVAERGELKKYWLELYQKKMGFDYEGHQSAFFNTQLKRLHETLGAAKAMQVFELYLAWNDPFVVKRGHPIELIIPNLNGLKAQFVNPEGVVKKIAASRATQNVLGESERIQEEMSQYARAKQRSQQKRVE